MDSLKKELEEELKLSVEDVRSHAWFHGPLRREASEELLDKDGDFLVREFSSAPGDYVLSCFWKNEPMHFKIICVVLRPKQGYSRELFQFEEDRFDNVLWSRHLPPNHMHSSAPCDRRAVGREEQEEGSVRAPLSCVEVEITQQTCRKWAVQGHSRLHSPTITCAQASC